MEPSPELRSAEDRRLLTHLVDDLRSQPLDRTARRPDEFASGRAILAAEPAVQAQIVLAGSARIVEMLNNGEWRRGVGTHERGGLERLLARLFARHVPLTAEDFASLLLGLSDVRGIVSFFPVQPCLRAVERCLAGELPSPSLRSALERLHAAGAELRQDAEMRKTMALLGSLLGKTLTPEALADSDDWGRLAKASLAHMEPTLRTSWLDLLSHAAAAISAKPTAAWLKRARGLIDAMGEQSFHTVALDWLSLLGVPGRAERRENATGLGLASTSAAIFDPNATVLRGLAWCCSFDGSPEMARALADAAEACFKKLPGIPARCLKAGVACVWALGAMEETAGLAQLQRLRGRVKLKPALKAIDKALDEAARRSGLTREDLDDLSVPAFDLAAGRRRWDLGAGAAEMTIVGTRSVDLRWFGPDGTPRKSAPAAVKTGHAAELKAIKQVAADVEKALSAQVARIERLLLTERTWTLAEWRTRYLDHPLLAPVSRRLIWWFVTGDRPELGAWRDDRLVDPDDRPLDRLSETTRVRLWHPILSDPATVDAWQRWLERHEITQPFKQAHREVYVLTDAELATGTYSNRFAGHVLRQHQLHALAQQRGWSFRLLGGWDNWNAPALALPAWNLRAEFTVEGVFDGDAWHSDAYACLHVTTDQVRFERPGERALLPLTEVPALVLSEVMRDVDLFVGVSSVGNDPTWQDGGPERFRTYWHDFSFGDLSATARTRGAVLERLLPRLKIAPRCALRDPFLVVRGDLRTYKIHLGSGNILMEPNNQYLCVVPDRRASGPSTVYLPFEGDTQLAVILSKAFLLAADTAITDPTITRQLR